MKVMRSGHSSHCTPANYFFGIRVRQPLYFGPTRTPGHLILSVLVEFSGV